MKSWATSAPYERPWCLAPDEFKQGAEQVLKGNWPRAPDDWWKAGANYVYAALAIGTVAALALPVEEAAVTAAAIGNLSKATAAASGGMTLFQGFKTVSGLASIERAYTQEAARRSYRPTI